MGRPSLNVRPTNVRIEPELLTRIDDLVGKGNRSQFIRDAVARALASHNAIKVAPSKKTLPLGDHLDEELVQVTVAASPATGPLRHRRSRGTRRRHWSHLK